MRPEIVLSIIAALLSISLIGIVLRRRGNRRVHRMFLLLNVSLLAYELSEGLHAALAMSARPGVEPSWLWPAMYGLVVIGIVALSTAGAHWYFLALAYCGRIQGTMGWRQRVIYLPTSAALLAILIQPSPLLIRAESGLRLIFMPAEVITGVCILAFLVWGSARYIDFILDIEERIYRRQAVIMAGASLVAVLGTPFYFAWALDITRVVDVNPILIALPLANALMAVALLGMGFLDLLPVAFREVFHAMGDAVLVLDPAGRVIQMNRMAQRVFPDTRTGDLLEAKAPRLGQQVKCDLAAGEEEAFECQLGEAVYWVRTLGLHLHEESAGLIIILTDITTRKRAEEQLAHDATHDRLTGLPNRALILERLDERMVHGRRRADYRFAMLLMDLDQFKLVNDSMGHTHGDQLLIQVAERVSSCLRQSDAVGRFGGDEFVIVMGEVERTVDTVQLAERVQERLKEVFLLDGQEVYIGASIGIVLGGPEYHNPEDLLRDADIALYYAKRLGRSRYALYDKAMHDQVLASVAMQADLRRAAERRELELYYQPVVSLERATILEFEALLRWRHPQKGLLMPSAFLPVAEETGLIVGIGRQAIEEACRQLAHWQALSLSDPPVQLSINLSQKQLRDPDLIDHLRRTLKSYGVAPGTLTLEITETAIPSDDPETATTLARLDALGVRLCLDDFGTGNSSLGVLHRYPIAVIKVDRSFLTRESEAVSVFQLLRGIMTLGQMLNKEVIVEGVETADQLQHLQALKCGFAQGEYFGPPMSADEVQRFLAQQSRQGAGAWATRSA